MELNIMLLRCMEPRLRRKMKQQCFRHDLPELDLTHTLNAAVTLQEIYRAKTAARLANVEATAVTESQCP